MKYIVIVMSALLLGACNGKKENSITSEEKLNYPFTKEGTLDLIGEEGMPFKTIDIEVADTEQQRNRGLMDRDSLGENQGMIFMMPREEIQTFYMKNTRIPLDLVYISSDSVVVDIQQGVPFRVQTIPSDTVSKYVLELNKGMAEKWGIQENQTKVRWQ